MTMVIILLGLGLAVSLAFNFGFFGPSAPSAPATSAGTSAAALPRTSGGDDGRSGKLEAELDKKKKELEELKKSHAEVKDELKATKKKVFEQKEASASGDDLSKARAEVERQASIQLENTRHELATALTELQKLRAEAEGKGKKKREAAEEKKAEEKPAEARPQEVITKVIRELSDVEKERIQKLESRSEADRKKAIEAEKELRSLKAKLERHHKESKHVFKEAELARDKFRAVEMRLNRTLLENNLLHGAVAHLEQKTGQHAEHTTPTAAEIAESDRSMTEKFKAEDKASAEALEKLMNAPATTEEAPAEAAKPAEAPAAAAAPATETPAASTPATTA